MKMKMLGSAFAIASLIGPAAFAQSSGSFTYGTGNAFTGTTGCALVSSSGAISGGQQCSVASTAGINLTCSVDADCLNIYGSNSGATCNNPTGVD
jgi:hypothetical protein